MSSFQRNPISTPTHYLPCQLFTILPSRIKNCLSRIHRKASTKRNDAERVRIARGNCIERSGLFPIDRSLFGPRGNWHDSQEEVVFLKQDGHLMHITCIVHDLCSHPYPRLNQRGNAQCNRCQAFGKNCFRFLRLQRFLSLNKN